MARAWLQALVASGDWAKIKFLRKSKSISKSRLLNLTGEVVASNMKVEILAEYFEKV